MPDLFGIIVPVLVSVILSVSAAFAVNRYSGPAQTALVAALDGRLRIVTAERDEAVTRIPRLEERITNLENEVGRLTRENAKLYRRLDRAIASSAGTET